MKVVYVAGPYKAQTEHGTMLNIREAEAVAIQVWQAGHVALTPHLNTRLFGGLCPDEVLFQGCLELLRRCDAVVLVKGWSSSSGTITELKEAALMGLPVYTTVAAMISALK